MQKWTSHGFGGWHGLQAHRVSERIIQLARHHYHDAAALLEPGRRSGRSRFAGPAAAPGTRCARDRHRRICSLWQRYHRAAHCRLRRADRPAGPRPQRPGPAPAPWSNALPPQRPSAYPGWHANGVITARGSASSTSSSAPRTPKQPTRAACPRKRTIAGVCWSPVLRATGGRRTESPSARGPQPLPRMMNGHRAGTRQMATLREMVGNRAH
jgi:hypothetical protein